MLQVKRGICQMFQTGTLSAFEKEDTGPGDVNESVRQNEGKTTTVVLGFPVFLFSCCLFDRNSKWIHQLERSNAKSY